MMEKEPKTIYCVGCRQSCEYTDPQLVSSEWASPINKIPVVRHQIKASCSRCNRRCSRFVPKEGTGP